MKTFLLLGAVLFAATASAQTSADVELTMTRVGSSDPNAGSGTGYQIHVANLGPGAAAGRLTGSYPAGVTEASYDGPCTVVPANCEMTFNLAAGEARDFHLSMALDAAIEEGTTITTQIQ